MFIHLSKKTKHNWRSSFQATFKTRVVTIETIFVLQSMWSRRGAGGHLPGKWLRTGYCRGEGGPERAPVPTAPASLSFWTKALALGSLPAAMQSSAPAAWVLSMLGSVPLASTPHVHWRQVTGCTPHAPSCPPTPGLAGPSQVEAERRAREARVSSGETASQEASPPASQAQSGPNRTLSGKRTSELWFSRPI